MTNLVIDLTALNEALDKFAKLIEEDRLLAENEKPHGQVVRTFRILPEEKAIAHEYAKIMSKDFERQNRSEIESYDNAFNGKLAEIIFKVFCLAHEIEIFADPTPRVGELSDEGDLFDVDDNLLDLDVKSTLPKYNFLFVRKQTLQKYTNFVSVTIDLENSEGTIKGWCESKIFGDPEDNDNKRLIKQGADMPIGRKYPSRYDQFYIGCIESGFKDKLSDLRELLMMIKSGALVRGA